MIQPNEQQFMPDQLLPSTISDQNLSQSQKQYFPSTSTHFIAIQAFLQNVAGKLHGQSKSDILPESSDKAVVDELMSRAAASNVPVTELAGRFMVPAEIGRRWTMGEMMQILQDQQAFLKAREKDLQKLPVEGLVDVSMLPLV